MIAQFLTEMDHCMSSGNIYIIGATNRPDLLDPSILQPGRFDVSIYLGINNDKETRISILKAKTRKMKIGADLSEVEVLLPHNFTGADIFSFVAKAYRIALARVRDSLEKKIKDVNGAREWRKALEALPESERDVIVEYDDFKQASKQVQRSVSDKDMELYKKFKQ